MPQTESEAKKATAKQQRLVIQNVYYMSTNIVFMQFSKYVLL